MMDTNVTGIGLWTRLHYLPRGVIDGLQLLQGNNF